MEIATVPIIISIVYILLATYKQVVTSEKLIRLIPIWAALLGGILGAVAYLYVPDIVVAENLLVAILIGIASGLSATGLNQVFKQLTKDDKNE